jgi:GGDEF domain-containing protein
MSDPEYPVLPLNCIDQSDPDALGQRCEACPIQDCTALAAGELILRQQTTIDILTERNSELEEENRLAEIEKAHLLERLFNLRLDSLVETAFTPEGLKDHLMNDSEIQEELRAGNWGVVRLDGRFVNYVNRFGNLVGDDFLQRGGGKITAIADGLVRTHNRRRKDDIREFDRRTAERRGGHSLFREDIICRQGGDEFALLIRNVTPAQLALITARVQSKLTVPYALDRYSQGQIPFIASVGAAHASDRQPEVQTALDVHDPWHAFRIINGLADEGQREVKSQQYKDMWDMVQRATAGNSTIAQPDDRIVAERFLTVLCPDFQRDPIAFLLANE